MRVGCPLKFCGAHRVPAELQAKSFWALCHLRGAKILKTPSLRKCVSSQSQESDELQCVIIIQLKGPIKPWHPIRRLVGCHNFLEVLRRERVKKGFKKTRAYSMCVSSFFFLRACPILWSPVSSLCEIEKVFLHAPQEVSFFSFLESFNS